MTRFDWVLLSLAAALAVSALIAPAGGLGVDGRHFLAAAMTVTIALRGRTDSKESA